MSMSKRTRLTVSLLTGIIFFVLFNDFVVGALGELVLLGCSVVYFLFVLKATAPSLKHYHKVIGICTICLLILSVCIAMSFYDGSEELNFSKSLGDGLFFSFVLAGTPLAIFGWLWLNKQKFSWLRLNKQKFGR
ncbi:hypothetical protein MZM54_02930 [[Brevibacterium] frigoritolerans]|nr:hypothetical protein [Peribacillus frigoritolerans]